VDVVLHLKPIDLSKSTDCDHPDIKTDGTQYLVRYRNCHDKAEWRIGSFSRQWFGINFDLGTHSVHFDDARYQHRSNHTPRFLAVFEIQDEDPDEDAIPVATGAMRYPRRIRVQS